METYLLCVGIVLGGSVWVRYLAALPRRDDPPERFRDRND